MSKAISAQQLVNIVPNVLGVGGSALALSGLLLTDSPRVPVGSVLAFASAAAVVAYFGATAPEAIAAEIYFAGPDGALARPAQLLFAQYNTSAVAGYFRGGPGITLAQVQAITTGTLTVTADGGASKTSGGDILGLPALKKSTASGSRINPANNIAHSPDLTPCTST